MRLSGYFLGFDREMGAWDPNIPNTCSKGDISDSDLMQLRIFPLGSFPLVSICRTPEQHGVGDGTVMDGIFWFFRWLGCVSVTVLSSRFVAGMTEMCL
jgi:hypothetical protein